MSEDADPSIIRNPTPADLQEAAAAMNEVFSSSKIKYAFCGGFLAILLGIRQSTEVSTFFILQPLAKLTFI